MITSEKIEQWIQEVQERPGSSPLIVQYIGSRLRDLATRNEELLAENIDLLNGKRVAEYEQRIVHLEYQLELLKRQVSGELPIEGRSEPEPASEPLQLLVYNQRGQVLRLPIQADRLTSGATLGRLQADLSQDSEPVRLLATPASEELLLAFSSGRIFTLPVRDIPLVEPADTPIDWQRAALPDEPRGMETLSYIVPISNLALADAFVQVSRRGFVKKLKAAMAQSILANHYIGTSTRSNADRTFALALCAHDPRLVLLSWEGYQLCLETDNLPYSVEEGIRLANTDHLVAAFTLPADKAVLVMTQIGKLIHQAAENVTATASLKTKGSPVFSAQRRAQGVRVVGAAAVGENDWGLALHQDGLLTLHAVSEMIGAGKIPLETGLVAFTFFPPQGAQAQGIQ